MVKAAHSAAVTFQLKPRSCFEPKLTVTHVFGSTLGHTVTFVFGLYLLELACGPGARLIAGTGKVYADIAINPES
jgi:hypothetical protein